MIKIFNYEIKNKEFIDIIQNNRKNALFGRLEFLGDSLLNFFITQSLYQKFIDKDQGSMSKLKALLVSGKHFAILYEQFGFEKLTFSTENSMKMKSNLFEVIFAAIYLDSNLNNIKKIYDKFILPILFSFLNDINNFDYKSILQSFSQKKFFILPKYEILSHKIEKNNKHVFEVTLILKDLKTFGTGSSVLDAEQNAAKVMSKMLGIEIC